MSDHVLVTGSSALPPAGQSEQEGQRMSNQWTPSCNIAFKIATENRVGQIMVISRKRFMLLLLYA